MSKRVYISADYAEDSGDRDVVDILNQWGSDNRHKVDFIDMSKVASGSVSNDPDSDVGNINAFSYLQHEFEQAKKRKKPIIIVYNSLRKESNWLPSYMKGYESDARPFWKRNDYGEKVGDYTYIKQVLGYA